MRDYMELQLFKKVNDLYEFVTCRLTKRRLNKNQDFKIQQLLTLAVRRISDGYGCGTEPERLNYYKEAENELEKLKNYLEKLATEGRVTKKDFSFCMSKLLLLLKIINSLKNQIVKESNHNKLLKFSFIK